MTSHSLTSALALLLAPLLAPFVAAAAAEHPREFHVVQATKARAYLDAGARDGLATGATVALHRGAASAGRCVVEWVSDHRASCSAPEARAGDTFALAPPPAQPPPQLAPPPLPAAEEARRHAAVEAAALAPVDFHAEQAAARRAPLRAQATLSDRSWLTSDFRPWQEERIDAQLAVPIGERGSFNLDATALHIRRPDGAIFRPGDDTQLYIWRAELGLRGANGFAGSLGRLIPYSAPGAPRMDGAQVGYHLGRSELGFFGGAIPDAQTLTPGTDRYTGGAYVSLGRTGDRTGLVSYAQASARIAMVHAPEWGSRAEAEASALAQLAHKVDLAAQARFGVGDLQAPGALDALRLSLDARPVDKLSLSAGFRYSGARLPVDGTGVLVEGPAVHVDGSGSYQLTPGFAFGAEAGTVQDNVASTQQSWIGPTVTFPSVFGALGGLVLGYREEWGLQPGRSGWVQASLAPARRLQLFVRASGFIDDRAGGSDAEVGLFVRLVAKLTEHFGAHLSVMNRIQVLGLGYLPSSLPYGVFIDAGIAGEL